MLHRRSSAAGGISGSAADAFSIEYSDLSEFAEWMQCSGALEERDSAADATSQRRYATFVGYSKTGCVYSAVPEKPRPSLRVGSAVSGPTSQTLIDQRDYRGVRQLSDGERGVLALVLDLTRTSSAGEPRDGRSRR